MTRPTRAALEQALRDAGSAHHDYEQVTLNGKYDVLWAGFYAAFTLGRIGEFATSSQLNEWLTEAPGDDDWAASAASHVLSKLGSGQS